MSKVKKFLCLLLAVLMVLTMNIPAFANDNIATTNNVATVENAEPIEITVSTDKSSYKTTNIATIYVTVKNVSDESLENVKAQAIFYDLQPVSRRNSTTSVEIDELQAGESFDFSYKATLNIDKHNLNFFQKIFLWFVRLFNGGYTASNSVIDAITENVTEIKFGNFTATNIIVVGYREFDSGSEDNNMISIEEIKKMEIVSNTISEYMKSEEYANLDSNEEKVEYINNLLIDLSNQGLIIKNSIQYSAIDNSFIYKHINGVRSFIWLNSSNNMEVSLNNYSYSYEHNENEIINNIYSSSGKISNSVDTVFMYGFDKINDKYSIFEKYDSLMREYSKQGLLTTIYSNPTVFDYKTAFANAKYINIIEHGGFDTNLNISYFAVVGDQPNENTLLAYNTDIYFERIFSGIDANGEDTFIIAPKFFEFYYSNKKLDGAVVFLFCCQGFGANGNVNYEFAKAFEKCGADTIIGFHNSVFEGYASSIYMEFTESMLYGYTTNDSLNSAVELYGKNDIEYGSAFFPLSKYWNKVDPSTNKTWQQSLKEHTVAAYPILYGDKNKKLDIKLSSITGTVTDSKTGNSISNVTVEVIDNDIDSFDPVVTTTTDANGKYKIELPYGSYSISYTHKDYETVGISLSVEFEAHEKNISLMPCTEKGKVFGTVLDKNTNELIPHVTIQLINSENVPVWTDITNENGEFVFDEKIPYGTYTIQFTHENYTTSEYTIVIDAEEVEITELLVPGDARPVTASGNCGAEGDNVTWTLYEDGELVISGSGMISHYTSTVGAPWSTYKDEIVSVIIEGEITTIGDYAFYNYENLKKVTIADGLLVIGTKSFNSCYSLSEIVFPESLVTLGSDAFEYCTNLINVVIPDNVTRIWGGAFAFCSKMEEVVIGNNVQEIGSSAFYECKSLKSITIPDSVTYVDSFTFTYCSNLETVIIGNGLNSISYRMFDYCENLQKITIGNNVKTIEDYAFARCTNLQTINIPESVERIQECAFFSCSNLSDVTVPNSVTFIGEQAFRNTAIYNDSSNWDNSVLYLGLHLIRADTTISGSYAIKDGTLSILEGAFADCNNLTNVLIPNSVTRISPWGFDNCTKLTTIIIPNTISVFENGTFNNCNELTDIYYKGTQEEWKLITIADYGNDSLINATIHYNS